jgi:hypothetical protein
MRAVTIRRRLPRRGVTALEEVMAMAVLLPLAMALCYFCWSMAQVTYHLIEAFVLTPVL